MSFEGNSRLAALLFQHDRRRNFIACAISQVILCSIRSLALMAIVIIKILTITEKNNIIFYKVLEYHFNTFLHRSTNISHLKFSYRLNTSTVFAAAHLK